MRVKGSGNALRAGPTPSRRLTGRSRRGEVTPGRGRRERAGGMGRSPVGTRARRCPKKLGIKDGGRVAVVSAPDGFDAHARSASRRCAGPDAGARLRRRDRVLRDTPSRAGAALPVDRARARVRRWPVGRVAEEDVGGRHRSRLRRRAAHRARRRSRRQQGVRHRRDVVGAAVRLPRRRPWIGAEIARTARMCGRFVSASSPQLLVERFGVSEIAIEEREPDYNVTPRAHGCRSSGSARPQGRPTPTRVLSLVRWGLVPSWAKSLRSATSRSTPGRSPSPSGRRTSGRSGSAAASSPPTRSTSGRPSKRTSTKRPPRQPYCVHRRDGEPLAFAGLWEIWRDPRRGRRRRARRVDPHVCDRHHARERRCSRRFTTACRSCSTSTTWDTWLDPSIDDVGDARATPRARARRVVQHVPGEHARQQARQQRRRPARRCPTRCSDRWSIPLAVPPSGHGSAASRTGVVTCASWTRSSTSTTSPVTPSCWPTRPPRPGPTRRCRAARTGPSTDLLRHCAGGDLWARTIVETGSRAPSARSPELPRRRAERRRAGPVLPGRRAGAGRRRCGTPIPARRCGRSRPPTAPRRSGCAGGRRRPRSTATTPRPRRGSRPPSRRPGGRRGRRVPHRVPAPPVGGRRHRRGHHPPPLHRR